MAKRLATAFFLILIFAACSPGGGGYNSLPGADAVNAASTISTYNLEIQATRQAAAQQTAVSFQATQQVAGQQTAVAQEVALASTATIQAQEVQATQIAMNILIDSATAEAIVAQAMSTATAAAQATDDADRAANIAMLRADEAARMAQERRRADINNTMLPILYLVVILAVGSFLAFVIWRMVYLSRNPVTVVRYNGQEMPLIRRGSFEILPPQSRISGASQDTPLLAPGPVAVQPMQTMDFGHVMIAGPTTSGKSTAMRAMIADRSDVVVIDPHYSPGDWGSARVIGGGGDYTAVNEYMGWMLEELGERQRQRFAGQRNFEPLTVATDELPAIVAEVKEAGHAWRKWIREGSKFGLWLIVCTQSTRVRTLGLQGEGDVLEQFHAVLYLGTEAAGKFPELVAGIERPAVLKTRNGDPQPVIVPNVQPNGVRTSNGNGRDFQIPAPVLPTRNGNGSQTTPTPPRQPEVQVQAIMTEKDGIITPDEVEDILRMLRLDMSQRRIENIVFGYPGGAAHRKVKAVKDHYTALAAADRRG